MTLLSNSAFRWSLGLLCGAVALGLIAWKAGGGAPSLDTTTTEVRGELLEGTSPSDDFPYLTMPVGPVPAGPAPLTSSDAGHEGHSMETPEVMRGPEVVDGVEIPFVGFHVLTGFDAPVSGLPSDATVEPWEIPAEVQALSGTRIAVEGFMVPYEFAASPTGGEPLVKVFYLTRDLLSCCFGGNPRINEALEVTMEEPVSDVKGRSAIVTGILTVREIRDETGACVCLYRLRGERVRDPW